MRRLTEFNRNIVLAVLVVLLGVILAFLLPQDLQTKVDWLKQSDWTHFNGANRVANGLKVMPTGRVINHRDTSTAQPNPPVNIRGSYLKVTGDFKISMKVSGLENESSIQFYSQIPIVYDEWRQEPPSIRLEAKQDELRVRIWDGTAANSIDERIFTIDGSQEANIEMIRQNKQFVLRSNGWTLGTIPDHKIFNAGTVWFGADAKLGSSGWTMHKLTAQGIYPGTVELAQPFSTKITDAGPLSLRNLAKNHPRKLPIGVAVSVGPLVTDPQYAGLALGQFSMLTPENSFKPQFIQPLKNMYLFRDTDTLVQIAKQNNMLFHGHSLVMGKANPEWMQKTPETERKQVMIDHIGAVVGRYKGQIHQWDVVNEPMSEDDIDYTTSLQGLRKQLWLDAMGEQYIDYAFKAARAADPAAKLFLNDFGLEKDGMRWDAFLQLVKRLQTRGVPIDGVGFEAHVYHTPADTIDPAVLKRHIQELAALGIESRISEIDVLGDDEAVQAQQYADVLAVCLSEPTCTSYGVWGITDKYGSTTLADRYPIVLGDSLIWRPDYTPRPALQSLQSVLSPK